MRTIAVLISIVLVFACRSLPEGETNRLLFNGDDLAGWDTYVGPSFDSTGNVLTGTETGLNNDPMKVFSVVTEDGTPAIRISGERFGGLSTVDEFENYHLRLEFKWGQKRWHPRANQKRDSGLLYHAVGDHAADGGFWMRSQEFQIQEGDCGDYWGVAGAMFDIPAVETDSSKFQYDPESPQLTFSELSQQSRHCIKYPDAEKPTGEWNVVEIYCHADSSIHIINGVVVMKLFSSRQVDRDAEKPLTKGKIQIQSEGAEVFYRAIEIRPIEKMPAM